MNADTFSFLFDGTFWEPGNPDGFVIRALEHVQYTVIGVVVAFVLAFPLGMLIGHTNRGSLIAINAGNAGRALPTLGVLMLVVVIAGTGLLPVSIALVLLAIPPILTTTYAGIHAADPEAVDAARGVGMKEWQIALQIELPLAWPVVFGGLRNATLQVVSTATIAAYVGLGGLGRYLFDGLALRDYPRVFAGAVLVAVLAVVLDLLIAGAQRVVVSPGVDGAARASGPLRAATVDAGDAADPDPPHSPSAAVSPGASTDTRTSSSASER